jgi:hypothetical protein
MPDVSFYSMRDDRLCTRGYDAERETFFITTMACDFGQQENHALEGCGFRKLQLHETCGKVQQAWKPGYIYTAAYAVLSRS